MGVAKPVWRVRDLFVQSILENDFFRTKSILIKEKNNLQTQNQDLISKLTELETLRADNEAFRIILGRSGVKKGSVFPVIAHPAQTLYDVIVVDVSEGQSVHLGEGVVSGNISLGEVSEVGKGFAKINFHSSPNTKTTGILLSSGTAFELEGKGGGNFSVRVPRDTAVEVGELVVLPGDSALALARVAQIEESEKDSFKLVRLMSPISIFSLRWVEIIR